MTVLVGAAALVCLLIQQFWELRHKQKKQVFQGVALRLWRKPQKSKVLFFSTCNNNCIIWHLAHHNWYTALRNSILLKESHKSHVCFGVVLFYFFFFLNPWITLEKIPWNVQNNYTHSHYPNRKFSLPMYLSPLVFFIKKKRLPKSPWFPLPPSQDSLPLLSQVEKNYWQFFKTSDFR